MIVALRIVVDLAATGRLRMTVGCDDEDEENAVELTPGEDDRTFILSQTPVWARPVYEDWRAPVQRFDDL